MIEMLKMIDQNKAS